MSVGTFRINGTYNFSSDINECLINNECHPMASCENTNGGFICQCKIGFTGDGSRCSGDNLQ